MTDAHILDVAVEIAANALDRWGHGAETDEMAGDVIDALHERGLLHDPVEIERLRAALRNAEEES